MTDYHRTPQWVALARTWRPRFQAQINAGGMRCGNHCQLGGIVLPGQKWDLSHIVDAHLNPALAYEPANLTVSHQRCNRSDGGKAARTKQKKSRQQALPEPKKKWNKRPW